MLCKLLGHRYRPAGPEIEEDIEQMMYTKYMWDQCERCGKASKYILWQCSFEQALELWCRRESMMKGVFRLDLGDNDV